MENSRYDPDNLSCRGIVPAFERNGSHVDGQNHGFTCPFLDFLMTLLDDTQVTNACPFTIWPATFTDLNVAPNVPSHATGIALKDFY
ncbi:hypothetical protein DXG01_015732 [Tephrocybe rancida]|nr:hypothetical protein DXG01_015732 [Tephrocybe rancida]